MNALSFTNYTFKFKHTPEDADALAADMIPENFATGLADSNWKTRLATLEEMTSWADGAVGELDAEVVVRFLGKKGWSEKNFQVRTSRRAITSAAHMSLCITCVGLHKDIRNTRHTCREMSFFRQVIGCPLYPAP